MSIFDKIVKKLKINEEDSEKIKNDIKDLDDEIEILLVISKFYNSKKK